MAIATTEQQMIELEQRYWQAIQAKDIDAILALTDDPCTIAGASGVARIDHAMYRQMMAADGWTLEKFTFGDDPQVRMLTDDVAIVAYTVTERLTVEGKPVSFEAADASTWIRRDGRWVCTLHTESVKGDPFGRDRNSSS